MYVRCVLKLFPCQILFRAVVAKWFLFVFQKSDIVLILKCNVNTHFVLLLVLFSFILFLQKLKSLSFVAAALHNNERHNAYFCFLQENVFFCQCSLILHWF